MQGIFKGESYCSTEGINLIKININNFPRHIEHCEKYPRPKSNYLQVNGFKKCNKLHIQLKDDLER